MISKKQRIKLDIFVKFLKKKHFLHFKTIINFLDFIVCIECDTFDSNSKLVSATNQHLLCITESNIGQGPSNHKLPLYELLVWILWLTLSFGEVWETCIRMHLKLSGRVPLQTYLYQINIYFFIFLFILFSQL